jgi:hypothetical protein
MPRSAQSWANSCCPVDARSISGRIRASTERFSISLLHSQRAAKPRVGGEPEEPFLRHSVETQNEECEEPT